jgi:hypothetical protein
MDPMWNAMTFCTLYADYRRELKRERRARHIRQPAQQAKRRRSLLRGLRRARPETCADDTPRVPTTA